MRVQSAIGAILIAFLGWIGVTLFQLNGTTASLDASTGHLRTTVEGLHGDMRDLRRSIDAQVAFNPRSATSD